MKFDITKIALHLVVLLQVQILTIDLPITESYFGCIDDAETCSKLCRVGFSKCDDPKNIKCEYNYFKLTLNSSLTECVLCPYTYDDPWMYLCMDCRENSETWQNIRTCSYNYKISSGSKEGAYLRENVTTPILFNIKHSLQIDDIDGRNATVVFIVEECGGCLDFCDESSETCNILDQISDIIHLGIECQDGYFFSNDGCQKCQISNCKICDWYECSECIDGYAYNYASSSCDKCFDGCKSCTYYDGTMYCDICNQEVYYDYRIPFKYGSECQECDYGCDRCSIYYEILTDGDGYETEYYERNRCRQCESSQFVTDQGSSCDSCYIDNCEICYYSFLFQEKRQNTLQLEFNYAYDWNSFQSCYKCNKDYKLIKDTSNADKKICQAKDTTDEEALPNCQSFSLLNTGELICLSCQSSFSLEYVSPTSNSCNPEQLCNKKIKFCLECISFKVNGVKQYQCLKCNKGYYPDIFAGLCIQCQAKCDQCWQYTDSYNITDYLQLQMAALDPDQYKLDLIKLQSEKLNDPWCTQCSEGFDIYNNACLGCSDDCQLFDKELSTQVDACQFLDNFAYCTQCLLPSYSQSLIQDMSQCNECPENCIACRERTQLEISQINPFFNPDFYQLLRFSNFCYKPQSKIDATKTLYLDPVLGVPILCSPNDSNKKKKCEQKLYYTSEISCEAYGTLQLAKILKQQKGKIATISLNNIENEQTYYYFNQHTLTHADITFNFVGGTSNKCDFTKSTQIKTGLQQNVFTLQKLTLTIIGYSSKSDQLTFSQTGRLILKDYSSVVIKNIKFVEASSGDFGFEIIGTKTSLTMINCSIKKSNKLSQFSIILQNTIYLELNQVSFTNINNDNIINQTSTNQITDPSQFIFNDVIIASSLLSYGLITVNQIGANNSLFMDNFKIISTVLNNTQLFNDMSSNSPFDAYIKNIEIANCTFTNSSMLFFTTIKKLEIEKFNFAVNKLEKGSTLITSTSFNIQKFFSFRPQILGNSYIFKSGSYLFYASQIPYANQFSFLFLTFIHTTCQNVNCLIKIQTPENVFSMKTNIFVSNLIIKETNIVSIQTVDINSVTSALISFDTVGNVRLQTMTIINSQGLSIFFISGSYALDFNGAQYYLVVEDSIYYSYDEFLQEGDDFDINYSLGDNIILTNPTNNLLPVSVDCAERKMAAYEFSSYLFYIEGFQGYVNVQNIIITDQIFIDRSAFVIKSYQNLQYIEPEQIIISNVRFMFNYLASMTNGQTMSLIVIESEQQQSISISNIFYESNHMHQVVDSQISETPLALMVDSPYSYFHIEKGYFNYNRVTRSLNGLIWAKVNAMQFNQTYFYKTNMIDTLWLQGLEESQLGSINDTITRANLLAYFTIQSYGANIYAIVSIVDFRQLNIEQSYGVSGAGIYLELTDGVVYISQSSFLNIQSSLNSADNTEGGCILINSESSKLQMKLENVLMQNCIARARGGCIHIFPTKYRQDLYIENSKFSQCQSFGYSFISNPFLESTDSPSVFLQNTVVSDNNYDIFVNNIPNLSLLEQLMLTQSSGIYYQHTGILNVRDCTFTNLKYVGIIQAIKMKQITITGTQIQYNVIFLMPLFQFSLDPIDDNFLQIVNSEFSNNNSTNISSIYKKCNILKQTFLTLDPQNCDIIDYLIDFQNYYEVEPLIWNDEQYLNEYDQYVQNPDIEYEPPDLYDIYYLEESEILSRFDSTFNNTLINCLLSSLLNITLEAGQTLTTSLIYLENAYSNSHIKFEKINVNQNQCLRCYAGLIQLIGVINIEDQDPLIQLNDVKCEKNIVGYYGCFLVQSLKDILNFVPNQNLQQLSTLDSTTRLLQLNGNSTLAINNSEFTNNRAAIGSGVAIIGLSALINGSLFYDNFASLAGAGVYYINLGNNASSQLYVNNLTFQNNHAQVGAALYLQDTELANVEKLDITFDYNQAKYAQTLQENTRRQTIQMVEGEYLNVQTYQDYSGDYNEDGNIDDIEQLIKDNITLPYQKVGNYPNKTNLLILPSGQSINNYKYFLEETQEYVPYEWRFRIINLNRFYEHVVNDKDGDKCSIEGRIQNFNDYDETIQFTNNFTTPSIASFSETNEGYVLDTMSVIFDPYFDYNYYLELRIECNSIKIPVYGEAPYYDIIGYDQRYYLFADIRTFPCQKGEVYQLMSCLPCNPKSNQYSVTADAILCSQFNSDYMISIKQSSIQLKPGYWRPEYSNDQSEYCENQNVNCKGGWVPGDPSCYTGHIGALCESCDLYATVNEEAYTQSSPFKCARCAPTMQLNYVVLVATSIVSFISMVLAVKGSYISSMQFIIEDTFERWGVLLKSEQSDLAVLMKVLTNYFQIIQFIASFGISIPSSLTQTAKTAGNPTESTTTAMDCLYATMTDLNVLYFRMVWSFIQPSIYIIGFYIIYFTGVCIKLLPYKINIITTALIYQFLYLQPTYVEGFIVLASSRTVSGLSYIQRDVAYRYDSIEHQYYLINYITPMLIIWVLVLPLLFMFMVYRNKATLESKQTKLIYGFFYLEYQINSFLWEFVKLFQKEFMVIILAYYDAQVIVKGLLLVVVMFLYGFYQISVSPYKNRRLNNLDRYSTVILSISLAMGVLLKSCQDNNFGYLFIIIAIIVIFINIPFLISILYYIFEGYIVKFSPILDKVRDIINEKYPDFKSKHPHLRPYLHNKEKMGKRVKELWGILRIAVYETKEICKEYDLPFKKVFPPYALSDEQGQSLAIQKLKQEEQIISEQKPLISEAQECPQEYLPEDDQKNIKFQSVLASGVRQQGQFYTASFINSANQEIPKGITGQGVEQWPDNTQYEGQIVNSKKQGLGKVTWPLKEGQKQQEFYEGNFEDDKFSDFGIYQWADGKRYEGSWKNGLRHGFGKYQGTNQYYEGEFLNDQYHGKGTLQIGNKQIIGNFENGKMDGEMLVTLEKKKRRGLWKKGQFEKWLD